MSIFQLILDRLRDANEEYELYECTTCGKTQPAITPHIVCPDCGGKLICSDIDNLDYSGPSSN